MKTLRSEAEIMKNWSKEYSKPLVSISCVTYNHEKYIEDALVGFLNQKTNFPFQICILDDASTDNNVEIIKEYAVKYPNIFKCFFLKENTWRKPYRLERAKPFLETRDKAKYIALCEGDDYWTDPYKLQKQLDFLEKNSDYGLVHSDYDILIEKKDKLIKSAKKKHNIKIPTKNFYEELLVYNFICTATVCARTALVKNSLMKLGDRFYNWKQGDYPIWMEISRHSKIGYINKSLAVHRVLEESAQNTKDKIKKYFFLKSSYDIRFYFINKYGCSQKIKSIVINNYHKTMLRYSLNYREKNFAKRHYNYLRNMEKKNRLKYFFWYLGSKNFLLWLIVKAYFKVYKKFIH